MKSRHVSLAGALALMMAAAGVAQAQDPSATTPMATPPSGGSTAGDTAGAFGRQGQIAILMPMDVSNINLTTNVSFIHTSSSADGSASSNTFNLSPTAHYFVAPDLSLSGGVIIQTGSVSGGAGGGSTDLTALGVAAGAGYNLRLTPVISAWPQGQIGYVHLSFSAGPAEASGYTIPLQILVPVLYHPAEHFFIGLGPILRTELASSVEAGGMSMSVPKQTDIGVTGVIGGCFGGT